MIYCDFFVFQADGIYDNPLDLMDIKPEFSDEETLNDSNTEPKVKKVQHFYQIRVARKATDP